MIRKGSFCSGEVGFCFAEFLVNQRLIEWDLYNLFSVPGIPRTGIS